MNKKVFYTAILMIISSWLFSQQDPMYTQYMFNTLSVNPAYAGTNDMVNVLVLNRNQWVGFNGAPKTLTAQVHFPIQYLHMGLGASLVNDQIGPINQTTMFFDYSFQLHLTDSARLAFGLKSGLSIYQSNLSNLNTNDFGDMQFNHNIDGKLMPNFGFGMYYYTNRYYVGASIPRLVKNDLDVEENVETSSIGNSERHYFLIAGYIFDINSELKLKPSMLTKVVKGAPVSVDITAALLIREQIWVGLMSRLGDSFGLLSQYHFDNNLKVGYAFDFTISEMQQHNLLFLH